MENLRKWKKPSEQGAWHHFGDCVGVQTRHVDVPYVPIGGVFRHQPKRYAVDTLLDHASHDVPKGDGDAWDNMKEWPCMGATHITSTGLKSRAVVNSCGRYRCIASCASDRRSAVVTAPLSRMNRSTCNHRAVGLAFAWHSPGLRLAFAWLSPALRLASASPRPGLRIACACRERALGMATSVREGVLL